MIQPISEQLREDSLEALQAKVQRYKDLWDFGFEEMREEHKCKNQKTVKDAHLKEEG